MLPSCVVRRLIVVAWLVIGLPAVTGAQNQPVGAVAALIGEGSITHAAQTDRVPARIRDTVYVRDRIETAERSVIRVLMGGRITVTIRERSVVTIIQDPMRPRVDLESGKLALKVHEGGLRAGEVAEILTPNAVTGIRGSLVVAEVAGTDSDVTVLEAHKPITIAPRNNPTSTTQLPIGHTVRVSGPAHAARVGRIVRATREHLRRVGDMAEVPGRPRDGGQERAFQRQALASRGDARRVTREHHVGAVTPPRREAMQPRRRSQPPANDAAAPHRANRAQASGGGT
jgi:FecR protein